MPTTVKADLYSVGNTATVVTDGFAFQATNEACVAEVDGEIKATKFGLHRIGPSTVKQTRKRVAQYGDELFDRIKEGVLMTIYRADTHYIPTTIDRVFAGHDNYAVYDNENNTMYNVRFDEKEQGTYNLVGIQRKTIQKVDVETLESAIGSRYQPLVKIESDR